MSGTCPRCTFPLTSYDSYRNKFTWASPLTYAIGYRHDRCFNFLLAEGADVNGVDLHGYTPLVWAVGRGPLRFLKRLIEAGADVNVWNPQTNQSPVIAAAVTHQVKCLEALIAAGAGVTTQENHGYSPVFAAVECGSIFCAKRLVEAGADVNNYKEPKLGKTILQVIPYRFWLTDSLRHACAQMLLEAGAYTNDRNYRGLNALNYHLSIYPKDVPKLKTILYVAGDVLDRKQPRLPDYLKFEMSLKHQCREAIRKRLMDLKPYQHLFSRVPQLRGYLPPSLLDYLLYGMTLEGWREEIEEKWKKEEENFSDDDAPEEQSSEEDEQTLSD